MFLSAAEASRQSRKVQQTHMTVPVEQRELIRSHFEAAITKSVTDGKFHIEGALFYDGNFKLPLNAIEIASEMFPTYKITDVSDYYDGPNMLISIKPNLWSKISAYFD